MSQLLQFKVPTVMQSEHDEVHNKRHKSDGPFLYGAFLYSEAKTNKY